MTVYDHIAEAQDALHRVHSCMIDALLESQNDSDREKWISSADFAELNALSKKLESLAERFAPAHEPLSFADLFDKPED